MNEKQEVNDAIGAEFDRTDMAFAIISLPLFALNVSSAEFDRTDMAFAIAEKTGLSPVEAKVALEGLAKVLPDALVEHGGRIEIHGLGVFRLEDRAPRKGIAPNGQPFETGERQEIVFHAAPAINQVVTDRTGIETYSA